MTTDRNELLALERIKDIRAMASGLFKGVIEPIERHELIDLCNRAIAARPSGEVTDDSKDCETYTGTVFYRQHGDGWCVSKEHHDGKVQEICDHYAALQAVITDCPKCAGYEEDAERWRTLVDGPLTYMHEPLVNRRTGVKTGEALWTIWWRGPKKTTFAAAIDAALTCPKCAGYKEDAERYAWLRSRIELRAPDPFKPKTPASLMYYLAPYYSKYTLEQMDAAIDTARKES